MTREREPFHEWIRLEQPRLGSRVTHATDEFFAAKERLIQPEAPVFEDGKYDDHGKWMDGWESRRKRAPGHDYCIVRLGVPGVLHGVDIDTSHFTGNYPPQASLDACVSEDDVPAGGWTEILGKVDLGPDAHHYFEIADTSAWTHVRLNIYPDGGVARLRLFGEVKPSFGTLGVSIDLLALENGGRAIACSDEHFGSMHNLNVAGRGVNMGDGWETARRRGPGNDWVIFVLGHPGTIDRVEIDTAHFKGNYPDRVSLEAAYFQDANDAVADSDAWQTLLPESGLEMDKEHVFADDLTKLGTVSHVRLSIYPDGGVSRLRLFGHIEPGKPE
ncbi:MAG: allantoicase [Woeseiaceae bacterium]|nr:allantoicase [Woeseiaceae bacterium]NIP21867.1 allantoicase [Woeseiaceae bacterium]NIS90952.1 allantoicase [Woeseiaceae bacterium]